MSVRRRALVTVLALLCLAALAPPAAGAKTSTQVIVSLKFPAFHGGLKSPKSACLKGRTVKLYRKKSGPAKLLGTDKSSPKGKWSIPVGKKLSSGSYFATVTAHGNCGGGKSKSLPID